MSGTMGKTSTGDDAEHFNPDTADPVDRVEAHLRWEILLEELLTLRAMRRVVEET